LKIVPLGSVAPLVLSVVAANIQVLMGLNTDVTPRQPKPEYAYRLGRRQYDAGKIIEALTAEVDQVPYCLGITSEDICSPILTFVYGESQLGGRSALISLYRITDAQTGVTCTRAAKIGVHEVGHLMGLGHCRKQGCLMNFSANIEKLDQLQMWFCDACAFEITRRLTHLCEAVPSVPVLPSN
jgi:archaemetzincin